MCSQSIVHVENFTKYSMCCGHNSTCSLCFIWICPNWFLVYFLSHNVNYFLFFRDMEMQREMASAQTNSSWQRASRWLDTQFLFIVCFLIVLMAIILYMKHLRLCPQKAAMTRVPSMSYFMTEQDQLEQGVRTVKSQGFILWWLDISLESSLVLCLYEKERNHLN